MKYVPTPRAVIVLGAVGAINLSVFAWPNLWWLPLVLDGVLFSLLGVDAALAPGVRSLRISRQAPEVTSAATPFTVRLELTRAPFARGRLRGVVRDELGPGASTEWRPQAFDVDRAPLVAWRVTPERRGDLRFGPVIVRLAGPLGLCWRQETVDLPGHTRLYPDLSALEAATAERQHHQPLEQRARALRHAGGREFDSLRAYRTGDDPRAFDWKATARRGQPIVREYAPEQDQAVFALIDCGRHMTGSVAGRSRLDLAVDAALHLGRTVIDHGDHYGVVAVSSRIQAVLAPRGGTSALGPLTRCLYGLDADWTETDWPAAIARAGSLSHRRALFVFFTDLFDERAASALIRASTHLLPRHLVSVATVIDPASLDEAQASPVDVDAAYARFAARHQLDAAQKERRRLRGVGVQVVEAPAQEFSFQVVRHYAGAKSQGRL